MIHASGTLGGQFNRRQTGTYTWKEAKAVAAIWEDGGSWDGKLQTSLGLPPEPPPSKPVSGRITIDEAVMIFLSLREGELIAPATLRKYMTFTKQLQAFAVSRGYIMLDQWASADVDRFYASLRLGARAKGKRLGTLRSFFRFCINRKWLPQNPVNSDLCPRSVPIGSRKSTVQRCGA